MWGGRKRFYSKADKTLRQRLFHSQSRYPQKKRTPRIVLFLGTLALLLLVIITTAVIFSGPPSPENGPDTGVSIRELNESEAYPQGPLLPGLRFDRLLLEKSTRRLTAFARGNAVRIYLVALGENSVGHKKEEGDRRTPEGEYSIDSKNPNSAYYKNLGISYPNAKDRAQAKILGKKPGGGLKIHGLAQEFANLGAAHRVSDWTHGSLAVTNEEMEELFTHTPVGTPIVIVP